MLEQKSTRLNLNQVTKNNDELYMERCLLLAGHGLGSVSTNPLVGCVIVHNGQIIGEGYHKRYGEAHAEVNAINSVKDKSLLPESTLYVNLEPCAHYGKTPPCADLIVEHDIKKVVIGTVDTFSEVAGKGIEKLERVGIDVVTGVLEPQCRYINRRFFTYNEKKRPYIVLKWAETADSYIGRGEADNNLDKRISNAFTDITAHRWRTEEDAIMVGTNTALLDNPSLTARLWEGRSPVRVVIDFNLKTPATHNIYNTAVKTIVVNAQKEEKIGNLIFAKTAGRSIEEIVETLYKHKIQSIIVEGGAMLLQSFIDAELWDEARIIKANKHWGNGIKAPKIKGSVFSDEAIDMDKLTVLIPH